jgi:prepilin-type N-terminal cleavage/methylation domain-containing protein
MRLPRRCPLPNSGFSLLETLVALTLIGMVLLFTLSILAHEARIERTSAAHDEALDILDTVHEAIRAGLPLSVGSELVDWTALYDPPRETTVAEHLTIAAEVRALSPPGLYHVVLTARYAVGPRPFERHLETMVWRPR